MKAVRPYAKILITPKGEAALTGGHPWVYEGEVTAVEGKVVTFAVRAFDEAGEIGHGTHQRVVINSQKFLDKAYSKL